MGARGESGVRNYDVQVTKLQAYIMLTPLNPTFILLYRGIQHQYEANLYMLPQFGRF